MVCFNQLAGRYKAAIEAVAINEGFLTFELSSRRGSSEGDNFLSDIVKVVVNGIKKDGHRHSLYLVVKISLKQPDMRENFFIQSYFRREVVVYTKMLPALEEFQKVLSDDDRFHYAKFYRAELDDDDEFLILEDLSARGLVMLDRMKSFDYNQLVACIKNLARLHATSIVLKIKDRKTYDKVASFSMTMDHIESSLTQFMTKHVSKIRELIKNEPYANQIGTIMDHLMEVVEPYYSYYQDDPYSVLCHGDLWTNNLFFDLKNGKIDKIVFLDWQLMLKASPVFDISYLLLIGIDSKMRSNHYYEMLDLYYETLSLNVSKMGLKLEDHYPRNIYQEHIEKYMSFGFILSFAVLPLTLGNKAEDSENVKNEKDSHLTEVCCVRMKELFEDTIKYNIYNPRRIK